MTPVLRPALIALVAAFALSAPALAAPAKKAAAKPAAKASSQGTAVGQFGDWGVFTGNNGKGKICYAATQPKKRAKDDGKSVSAGPAFIFITSRPAESVKNEVSVGLGFKPAGDVSMAIGGQNFALYAKDEGAWVKNAADEAKLVQAMAAGSALTLTSTSASTKRKITDSYSLKGLGEALEKASAECK